MYRIVPLLLSLLPIVLPHTGLAQSDLAADSLYEAGEYGAAAEAYAAIAHERPDSGRFWYRLGSSLHQVGEYEPAVEALEKAAETFQPVSWVHYLLAQIHAEAGHDAEAIAEVRRTADAGGIPYAVLVTTEAFGRLEGDPDFEALMNSIDPCGAPEYRQFDFWIGEWRIMNASGNPGGTNTISRELNGCVLVERYAGLTGLPAGMSQNFYHQGDGRWHQNWIDGQARNPLWLEGGLNGRGEMVMLGRDENGVPFARVTWTPNPDGTVRHHSERSTDGGATWTTAFDGLYTRIERAGE